jgi:hypothetical protein
LSSEPFPNITPADHIVHHILTLYALGAPADIIKAQYDHDASYQRPPQPIDEAIINSLRDPATFNKYLNKERYYHDYLVFFQREISKKGYEAVINEYVFSGDARAEDMFCRMYAGFLHPIIHLGFGVEFKQPAIIAEALAEAVAHDNWISRFLLPAEKAAKETKAKKSLVQLLDEIHADKKLSTAAQWKDGNKICDGIIARAGQEMINYAAQYTVSEDELEEKTAEMINTSVYFTAAAQHPPKEIKFDFYFMHCVNSSIFYTAFLQAPWISTANKVRLLEWKGRMDLAMYASRRSPPLLLDEVRNYEPKKENQSWDDIFRRVTEHEDDGHAVKLVRAIRHAQVASEKYEGREGFRIGGDMWLKIGNMAIDSVEGCEKEDGKSWVRSAGFEEAWEKFQDRPRAQL